jgi:hypothetical protein
VVSDGKKLVSLAVVIIGAVLFAFQQFAGINAIFYFSSAVFKSAGLTSEIGASVAVGVVNLIGEHQLNIIPFLHIDDVWLVFVILMLNSYISRLMPSSQSWNSQCNKRIVFFLSLIVC